MQNPDFGDSGSRPFPGPFGCLERFYTPAAFIAWLSKHHLLNPCSLQAAVWKAERQSLGDMVLSRRPLLEEAAVCLSELAPAALPHHSTALLIAYLDICADCGDWQTAVIVLRCLLAYRVLQSCPLQLVAAC